MTLLILIIDDKDKVQGHREYEGKVIYNWEKYNVKQVIDLMVVCWDNVTPVTIHHTWLNISEGLSGDCHSIIPGDPQSVQAKIETALEDAWQILGSGFGDTTDENIQELLWPAPPAPITVDDIIEEEYVAQEDGRPREEEEGGDDVWLEGLSIGNIKEINDLGGRICHFSEQDVTIKSEARQSLIIKALAGCEERYHAHINSLQQ